jgi:hypothetical protein
LKAKNNKLKEERKRKFGKEKESAGDEHKRSAPVDKLEEVAQEPEGYTDGMHPSRRARLGIIGR